MKNLYLDRLDSFGFEEMLEALQSISQETYRLDFKRLEIGKPNLAHLACAFANADGGIIAIGFKDPEPGKTVELADPVNVSDKAITALAAAINARVHPPLPMELFGYSAGDGRSFMVMRIERSETAPHEYIHADFDRNLPVRRNTHTGSLRLSEIDALRARGHSPPSVSPLGQKPHPAIPLMASPPGAENGFVLHIRPDTYPSERLVLDADDDYAFTDIVAEAGGARGALFGPLHGHTNADGIHFYAGDQPHWQGTDPHSLTSATQFAPEQITIDSDGEIALRFLQNDNKPIFQFYTALGAGYILAQKVFYRLELSPFARASIMFRLDGRRLKESPVLPNYYHDSTLLDLAVESYTEAFIATTLRMYRTTDIHMAAKDTREELERFESDHIKDLRSQWA